MSYYIPYTNSVVCVDFIIFRKLLSDIDFIIVQAFKSNCSVRYNVIIDGKTLEQISFLGCDMSYGRDRDVDNKFYMFKPMCGKIRRKH